MLLVIIGLAVAIISVFRVFKTDVEFRDILKFSLIHGLLFALGLVIACLGIGAAFHGYHEPIMVQEYELCELIESTDVYVIYESNGKPFFISATSLDESSVNDADIEVVFSDKYNKPTLVKYQQKAKKGILSLGLFGKSYDYKIYAAEKNIKSFK